ncbi:hypothetical protein PIIN_11261 [Serendipita indica DSM 11827]|uniref:Uncharacterized protein n=1 Tax=Serendipita indica (strain DSM 11827) TaxID=1109443 RepID=G4U140_SERID|nr:hypothetical protein PIIN_11261 [Serendipita indica DSM 11827]
MQLDSCLPAILKLFTLPTGGYNLFTWRSCGIGIQNQIVSSGAPCTQRMQYDHADVANVARYLAWNCQAAQNAHGDAVPPIRASIFQISPTSISMLTLASRVYRNQ